MNRPNLTKTDALKKIAAAGIGVFSGIFVLAIRGYFKDTMGQPGVNDINIYDDAMFIIGPNLFKSYNGNTDPSKHKPGIATLVAPQVVYFKPGMHGISGPAPDMAFRQDSNVTVAREGEAHITDSPKNRFWIDLHRGGYSTTSSLGCQTVHPDQWVEFRETGFTALHELNQSRMPYILIEN